jgi:hypothetical protein
MRIRSSLLFILLLSGSAHASTSGLLAGVQLQVEQEKKDAVLNIDRAAAAGLSDDSTLDGLVGVTGDFNGSELPAYVVFDASVPEEKMAALANFQGRIKGSVQCKRIRLGSSPAFPHVKTGVLAEQCTIKSLNH